MMLSSQNNHECFPSSLLLKVPAISSLPLFCSLLSTYPREVSPLLVVNTFSSGIWLPVCSFLERISSSPKAMS